MSQNKVRLDRRFPLPEVNMVIAELLYFTSIREGDTVKLEIALVENEELPVSPHSKEGPSFFVNLVGDEEEIDKFKEFLSRLVC